MNSSLVRMLLPVALLFVLGACRTLTDTAADGDIQAVRELLDDDVEPDSLIAALAAAAEQGHVEVVRLLLEAGANVNPSHSQPLVIASKNGHESVMRVLLDHGADVNFRRSSASRTAGEDALWQACYHGHESIVRLLLDNGVDIDNGHYLSQSAGNGHESVVRLLLDHGADVNLQELRDSALMEASANGHESVVRFLLDHGADVNLQARNGSRALGLAKRSRREDVVKMLLDHGGVEGSQLKRELSREEILRSIPEGVRLDRYIGGTVIIKKALFRELVKDKENWPALIRGLKNRGDQDLAMSFMNESTGYWFRGGVPLYEAGIDWARAHGCVVTRRSRAGSVSYILGGCSGY